MFGSDLHSGGELVILKEDKDTVIAGYASVDVVDKQNDKITLGAIKEAADKFMKQDRYRNVMITHSNVQVGEVVDQYTDSNGKVLKTGVDDTGFFVVIKLRSDIEKAKDVARDIRRGKLRSFSIGGQAINKTNKYDSDAGTYKEIDKLELHEITICEEGINPEAKFNIVKEDKNMSEIEKALSEFNEVMAELKETILKEEGDKDIESMDSMREEGADIRMEDVDDEEATKTDYDNDEKTVEMGDYETEDYEAGDYDMDKKSEEISTLDLSPSNIEKAYEAFRAEKEEERAYAVIKEQFENRYKEELLVEKAESEKAKFDAQSAIGSIASELSELKKSLESDVIAKAEQREANTVTVGDIANMSWEEAHNEFSRLKGGN
jgi:HK97 family phage prohead protease